MTLGAHDGPVTAVAITSDARLAVTTGTDRTVRWDLAQPRELSCFTADWPVLACAFTDHRRQGRPAHLDVVACDAAGNLHVLEVVGSR